MTPPTSRTWSKRGSTPVIRVTGPLRVGDGQRCHRDRGRKRALQMHLGALRSGTAEPFRADIPSPRKITSRIMRPRETLAHSQEQRQLEVRLACPDITALQRDSRTGRSTQVWPVHEILQGGAVTLAS